MYPRVLVALLLCAMAGEPTTSSDSDAGDGTVSGARIIPLRASFPGVWIGTAAQHTETYRMELREDGTAVLGELLSNMLRVYGGSWSYDEDTGTIEVVKTNGFFGELRRLKGGGTAELTMTASRRTGSDFTITFCREDLFLQDMKLLKHAMSSFSWPGPERPAADENNRQDKRRRK